MQSQARTRPSCNPQANFRPSRASPPMYIRPLVPYLNRCIPMALCALLACLLLVGPRAQFPSSPFSQQTYSIRGTVINSATGEPIRGALAQLFAQRQRSQLTGPGGEFQFDNILAGSFA